jgi:hypothetical protein
LWVQFDVITRIVLRRKFQEPPVHYHSLDSMSLDFRSVRLNSSLHLVPRLGLRGAMPPLFPMSACLITVNLWNTEPLYIRQPLLLYTLLMPKYMSGYLCGYLCSSMDQMTGIRFPVRPE